MPFKFQALIFDLGGVLLEWNPKSATALSSEQLRAMMHSTVWFDLDRGAITLEEACEVLSVPNYLTVMTRYWGGEVNSSLIGPSALATSWAWRPQLFSRASRKPKGL